MSNEIFSICKTRWIANKYNVSDMVVLNWHLNRTQIPPEVEMDMDRIVDILKN